MYVRDTIAAISTPPGESGIGIVRLSGDESFKIASKIFKPSKKSILIKDSFKMTHGCIVNNGGQVVDEVLVSVMQAPRSYTAEDVVEINCHGGTVALGRTLELVLGNGARLANPGEFTKRAYLNGRIDLAQAEAVADIIRSKSEASLKAAMGQLRGQLSGEVQRLRGAIISTIAQVEAAVDFSDEDIEPLGERALISSTREIVAVIDKLLSEAEGGKVLREGALTAIVGSPNVGKSSLLNLLLREERAIVTSIPGTTRDVIEEVVNVRGIPLVLRDTAGIRKTVNEIEVLGVKLSQKTLETADLVLFVIDSSQLILPSEIQLASKLERKNSVVVLNKIDLKRKTRIEDVKKKLKLSRVVELSATKGLGLENLEEAIFEAVFSRKLKVDGENLVTNIRHIRALKEARDLLAEAVLLLKSDGQEEVVSLVLRESADKLGDIIGETTSEDILNEIFSSFCIGK